MPLKLQGQVALVTGGSRGIGKGIALQLGQAGATVYITGRYPRDRNARKDSFTLPSLEVTANYITERGGHGIAVYCDHSNPVAVEKVFEQINKEQGGRLDILVNNAYAAVDEIIQQKGKKFYEFDPDSNWDKVNNVGLKNHFVCATYAARMMVPRGKGLIVTISSFGGMNHTFNVCYGVGKAACDRLAADIAVELEEDGITSIAIWPGPVKTELIRDTILSEDGDPELRQIFQDGESIEFVGKCVVALATDPNKLEKSGRIMMTDEIAEEYNLTDENGKMSKWGLDGPGSAYRKKFLHTVNELRCLAAVKAMLNE